MINNSLFHNINYRTKAIFFSILCIIFSYISKAQSYDSLQAFYSQKLAAELAEYKIQQPPKYLRWLPTVGVTSIFTNNGVRFGPSISLSSSQFISGKREQYSIKAKMSSISKSNMLDYSQDILKSNAIKSNIISKKNLIDELKKQLKIRVKLFHYDSIQFANNEINPDRFYQSKLSLMSFKQTIAQQNYELQVLYNKFYLTSKQPYNELFNNSQNK